MRSHGDPEQEQPSLFGSDDLVIPTSMMSLRKAVSAIHAIPVRTDQNHTLNTRRLFDACIFIAQLDFKKRGRQQVAQIFAERITPSFETRITDLARIAGIPGKNFNRIYEDLNRLFEMVLKFNVVGEDSEVIWDMKSHFLSSLGVGKGVKRGMVKFSIDPSILEIVMEPRIWAALSLQAMKELGTPASYALFQNAFRYANTHAKVTAPLPTETWIELLVGPSRYVERDTATGKVTTHYGDFKRRVLLDAIARVNDVQALGYVLELKETRSGNRVSKLQFKLVPKKQASLGLPMTWQADVLKVLEQIGFSETEVVDLSQSYSSEEVMESLVRLKAAEDKAKVSGRPIASRKLYFNGILANVAEGAGDGEVDQEAIEAEGRALEAARVAAARQERMREGFAKHQATVFVTRLFELGPSAREAITSAFEESAAGSGAKLLLSKSGWTSSNAGALSMLRTWMVENRPEDYASLLCNPEDTNLETWLSWRLDALQTEQSAGP